MVRPLNAVAKVQLTQRTLTRSHVALGARPALRAAMAEAAHQVAALLSTRLAAPVEVEVELLASAVRGSSSLATPAVFALLSLDEVGGFAVAELAPQLVSALVDRLAGGAGEPLAPQPMSEAEEAGASLLILDALTALRTSPAERALGPRLVRFVHSAAELSALTDLRVPHLAVRAHVRCEKAAGWVRVLVPASALRFWLEGSAAEYAPLAPEVAAAGLPFAIRAGHAALTPTDLDALVTGDVILFDGVSGTRDALTGAARIAGPHFALSGVIGPDGFTVEALNLNNKESTMSAAAT